MWLSDCPLVFGTDFEQQCYQRRLVLGTFGGEMCPVISYTPEWAEPFALFTSVSQVTLPVCLVFGM